MQRIGASMLDVDNVEITDGARVVSVDSIPASFDEVLIAKNNGRAVDLYFDNMLFGKAESFYKRITNQEGKEYKVVSDYDCALSGFASDLFL